LSEPSGELLVAQRIERPQEDPFERRVLADGEVFERTSTRAEVRDGEVQFERVPLEWREVVRLDGDAVASIASAIRDGGVLELPEEHAPPGTSAGGSLVTYTVALDGREHSVRLINLAPAQVPGVAELDLAVQLAVGRALNPE
jgi:hypothetical protein